MRNTNRQRIHDSDEEAFNYCEPQDKGKCITDSCAFSARRKTLSRRAFSRPDF